MKIRMGFVSNSSSSSFIVGGVNCDTLEDVFKKMVDNEAMFCLSNEYAGDGGDHANCNVSDIIAHLTHKKLRTIDDAIKEVKTYYDSNKALDVLKKAKKDGIKNVLFFECGDNSGEFIDEVGRLVDYELHGEKFFTNGFLFIGINNH